MGLRAPGHGYEVTALTADTALTAQDLGKVFTNRGAAGAVAITLPVNSTVNAGDWVLVFSCADQNLTVLTSPTDTLVADNDLTADSVALSTSSHKIGGGFLFIFDGTGWLVLVGAFLTQTVTTAT